MTINDLMIISPEIFALSISLILLIFGLVNSLNKHVGLLGIVGLFLVAVFLNEKQNSIIGESDYLGLLVNENIIMWKGIMCFLGMAIIALFEGASKINNDGESKFEFIFILYLSIIGGMISISASNILVLFVALELVALSAYIFACYKRNQLYSVEAGMKYFILGALATSIMIFGMSFIYGFSNSLAFTAIANILQYSGLSTGIIFGSILFLIGILFKLSIFPFHFWTPDIYQGSPLVSLAYFASIPKFITVIVLANILNGFFFPFKDITTDILWVLGILSIITGAFGGISQNSLKRLLGYSTVMNMGFVLLVLSNFSNDGNKIAVFYVLVYGVSSIGLISTMILTSKQDAQDYVFDDFAGFGKVKKIAALSIMIFMLSMAGIPPFAGFFAKYFVIQNLLNYNYILSAALVVIFSVVGAFYYINVIKSLYFSIPSQNIVRIEESPILKAVSFAALIFIIFLPLFAL